MTIDATEVRPEPASAALYLARLCGALFVVLAIGWAFQVPSRLGISVYKEQFLLLCLGLAGAVVFLTVRYDRSRTGATPLYDWALALLTLAVTFYISWYYEWFLLNTAYTPPLMLVLGTIVIVLVMEGLRRVSGWVLFSIVIVFMIYALIAHLVPAPLTGTRTDIEQLAIYLAFDTNALIGIPLGVATTIVVIFIFMGQVLFNTGGGEFFTDIASATMGRQRGGAAKISVVASALFGSISGSAISNVTTTGVITIPLMKKSGYSARRCRRDRGQCVDRRPVHAADHGRGRLPDGGVPRDGLCRRRYRRDHSGPALLFCDLHAGRSGRRPRPHPICRRPAAVRTRRAGRGMAFHRALRRADLCPLCNACRGRDRGPLCGGHDHGARRVPALQRQAHGPA